MATPSNQANIGPNVLLYQIISLALVIFIVAISLYGLTGHSWLEQIPDSELYETNEVAISTSLDANWVDVQVLVPFFEEMGDNSSVAELCNTYSDEDIVTCIDDRYLVMDFQEAADKCYSVAVNSNDTEVVEECNEINDMESAGDMAQFFLGFGILFAVLAILMIILTLGGLNTRHNFTAAGWFGLSSGTCLLVGVFLWAIMMPSQTEDWQYGSNVYLTLLGSVSGIFGGAIPLRLRKRAFANVENWPTKTRVQSPAGYASPQVASPNPVQPQLQWSGMPVEKRRLEEAYDKLPSTGTQQVQQVQGTPWLASRSEWASDILLSDDATSPQQNQSTLEGRFSVKELLAEGGMAQVFLANEAATNQTVIWKQAHGKHNPLKVSNKKLEEEAELMQIIHHQRIPAYIAHGEIKDSKNKKIAVLVQEFIEGGDLKNTVEQVKKVGMNMPLGKCLEYLTHICEPLEQMASMPSPVYHRDLKPHNIIVHPIRGPVIIDFGLAKMVATGQDLSVTRGGSGTWTPPERDSGVTGPFTDVWSLGKILYFIITNESPPAILDQDEMVATFSKLGHPEWLAGFISWACWPQYQKRIQSVQQFQILLGNEGVWPESSGEMSGSSSDDFTTWS